MNIGKRTKACLVPTGNQNPPLLGSGRLGLDGKVQSLLPVVQGENIHLHLANLGFSRGHWIMPVGAGDIGAEVSEEILELGLVLLEWSFLRGGKKRQGRQDRGREAHLAGTVRAGQV